MQIRSSAIDSLNPHSLSPNSLEDKNFLLLLKLLQDKENPLIRKFVEKLIFTMGKTQSKVGVLLLGGEPSSHRIPDIDITKPTGIGQEIDGTLSIVPLHHNYVLSDREPPYMQELIGGEKINFEAITDRIQYVPNLIERVPRILPGVQGNDDSDFMDGLGGILEQKLERAIREYRVPAGSVIAQDIRENENPNRVTAFLKVIQERIQGSVAYIKVENPAEYSLDDHTPGHDLSLHPLNQGRHFL